MTLKLSLFRGSVFLFNEQMQRNIGVFVVVVFLGDGFISTNIFILILS